jgi:hypothetical protein
MKSLVDVEEGIDRTKPSDVPSVTTIKRRTRLFNTVLVYCGELSNDEQSAKATVKRRQPRESSGVVAIRPSVASTGKLIPLTFAMAVDPK